MPGVLKSQSYERLNSMYSGHEADTTRHPPITKPAMDVNEKCKVSYIPSQMDPLASTSTRAMRQNPLWLLLQDAGVLMRTLIYLPNLALPLKASNDSCELHLDFATTKDIIVQTWLFMAETMLLSMTVPTMLILPGGFFLFVASLCCLGIYIVAWTLQGPRIKHSKMDAATMAMAEQRKDERWIFVNGCATGNATLQKNIDRLCKTFGRAVTGIHNRTYGLPFDLLECLIQRCFSYNTMDIRVTYSHVKAMLADPTVNKVVLIGHSQGGIIISLVLDHLFGELPAEVIAKLEVYTFGSAASHFSNPLISFDASPMTSPSPKTSFHPPFTTSPAGYSHVIQHIEHYANEYDMIPRWGVLHGVRDILNDRYSGNVFVRAKASGHLFNQHYMEAMFPEIYQDANRVVQSPWSILDTVVDVEDGLALKREGAAAMGLGAMRMNNGQGDVDGQILLNGIRTSEEAVLDGVPLNGTTSNGTNGHVKQEPPVMIFSRNTDGIVHVREAEGKTVRQLSRLWRYQGGRSPEDIPNGMFSLDDR